MVVRGSTISHRALGADRHIEEVIALASDYASACGAYDEAVKRRPGKLITLRQKARLIKKS